MLRTQTPDKLMWPLLHTHAYFWDLHIYKKPSQILLAADSLELQIERARETIHTKERESTAGIILTLLSLIVHVFFNDCIILME